MRRYLLVQAVTAAVTPTGFAAAGGVPAGAAAPGTRAVPGAQLWVARYDGGAKSEDHANAMAVSPDGRRVFVTGQSYGGVVTGRDYATVAYSAATGRRLWVSRYSGPWKNDDAPLAVAVSPDGSRVFVTGAARGWGAYYDYATVAYDAVTGRQLWVSRYNDPGNGDDFGNSVAVSPDGSTVFVTGQSGDDYTTVAYSAATGRQAVGSPLPRARERDRRRQGGGGEPGRDHGVRDRGKRRPEKRPCRLRHGRRQRRHRQADGSAARTGPGTAGPPLAVAVSPAGAACS